MEARKAKRRDNYDAGRKRKCGKGEGKPIRLKNGSVIYFWSYNPTGFSFNIEV